MNMLGNIIRFMFQPFLQQNPMDGLPEDDKVICSGQWHGLRAMPSAMLPALAIRPGQCAQYRQQDATNSQLPALPPIPPLVPERSDFFDGDAPAADKVGGFLTRALAATGSDADRMPAALVPWICDSLLSNHSVKACGRDFMDIMSLERGSKEEHTRKALRASCERSK
jgi:hypothetical protein